MVTKQQNEAMTLYANVMSEIKVRIAAIDHCTLNRSGLAPPFVKEFCFLQLRMVCELITLGCLVAHGDLQQTKKLRKEWAADKIIEELKRLHPDFFPYAVRIKREESGHLTVDRVPGRLTKEGLTTLYHQCGSVLHKGNVKKLLKANMPIQVSYPDITAKAQSILDLLSEHTVSMLGNEKHFICMLRNRDNQAQVAIAEMTEGPGLLA